MEKINKLVLCLLPNQVCDLKCEYCYISQLEQWKNFEELKYSPKFIVQCLSKKRLGGTSLINLTGEGETFLVPQINDIIVEFLREGHYVEVVTNGTIKKKIHELLQISPELLSHLFFKISFHYKELRRTHMLESFFETVNEIKNSVASFTLELMAYDGIENDIDEIQRICKENAGAVCHVTVGRDDKRRDKALLSHHAKEDYKKIWGTFKSPMFQFKMEVLGVKRKEFCYAGAWSLSVNLYTGETQPCYWQPYNQNIYKNPDEPILFKPVGRACTLPYCYNAHAHMTWGVLPGLSTPTYCDMRNRVCTDGSEWLKPNCKEFFNSRLKETNQVWSKGTETLYCWKFPFLYGKWLIRDIPGNTERIKRFFKRIYRNKN